MLAKILIDLINLIYNLNNDIDGKDIYIKNGIANAINLECYFHSPYDKKYPSF